MNIFRKDKDKEKDKENNRPAEPEIEEEETHAEEEEFTDINEAADTRSEEESENKMEEICKEIDAEIVGCIEITNDYQIEFKRDMTYDELMQISTELEENYYFIESVTLNLAMSVGYD